MRDRCCIRHHLTTCTDGFSLIFKVFPPSFHFAIIQHYYSIFCWYYISTYQCYYSIIMANTTNAIMYLRFIFVKLIHHMHYEELVFSFYNDRSSDASQRLNTMQWHFANFEMNRYHWRCLFVLDCTVFSIN